MAYARNARPVLENLSLDVEAGSFVAILGRSGSGKSTLLNLVGAMDRPLSGVVEVAGVDLTRADERTQTLFRRRMLGFVFQDFNLVPVIDVRHNVALPLALNDIDAPARVDALLAELGLTHLARRYPAELSGGEQQRVAIGRALVHRPRLVIADEPTGNLDFETSSAVLALFHDLIRRHGSTVVMATHSLEAARHADRVLRLVDGRLVEGM